jgi:hypothetical protein
VAVSCANAGAAPSVAAGGCGGSAAVSIGGYVQVQYS